MSGINGSVSINFNKKTQVEFEIHSFSTNTLRISSFSEDSISSMYLYLSATPDQFRQIGMKCLEFADELELKKNEVKEAPAA